MMRLSKRITMLLAISSGVAVLGGVANGAGAAVRPDRNVSPGFVSYYSFDSTQSPSGRDASLTGVVCPGGGSACFAVGSSNDGAGNFRRLLERYNGSQWIIQNTPAPAGSRANSFADAACPSATSCYAVGRSDNHTLIEHWNGASWAVVASPSPTVHSQLNAISCPATTRCFAVGASDNGRLLERFDGGSWTVQNTPGTSNMNFNDVACANTSNCTIVGARGATALIEHFNGSSWSLVNAPTPHGREPWLQSVSCPTTTTCVAGGASVASDGTTRRYVVRFNGSVWYIEFTPAPDDAATGSAESNWVNGVSCSSATLCAIVGGYEDYNYDYQALTESYDSSYGWSIAGNEDPYAATLDNVRCGGSVCLAVGDNYGQALVERGQ